MADIIQQTVVDRFEDGADRPLGIGWRDDLVRARGVLIGGEDADLTPGHLLFVDVHRLKWYKEDERDYIGYPLHSVPLALIVISAVNGIWTLYISLS